MKEPDWDLVKKIYHDALNQPPSQRRAFIATASEHDSVLEREVLGLLDAGDSLGDFLNEPVVELTLTPSADNLLGTTIDERYLIEKELGQGGMSQVYLARDLKVNRRAVVIKILSRELLENSYALKKFKQETEALSRIHYEGVVEVLDTGELPDGRPYFVMQYVDGESLRSQIPNEGMNLEGAGAILRQIGAALEHAHGKGVFHRDLKPENILLKRDTDTVVLVDFGIAKVKDSLIAPTTVNGDWAGTLLYMSPEQLRGEEITATSDIYSMGVIAYEMVTGRRPFNPASPLQLLELQRKGVRLKPIDLRENLSTKAQTIILRALSFEPTDRYDHATEFGDKLAQALLSARDAPRKKTSAKVIGASLLVLITAALISFGIYKYISGREPEPGPSRSFTYFLTVQKMRDGQPYQIPFKSNGDETFENGDKFRLTAFGPVPGYLYLINEGPPAQNDTSFTMIYPAQSINNGSASLGANQPVDSGWITFRGPAGNENFWIVWSTSPVSQLESAKTEAFNNSKSALTGQTLVTVKEYLTATQSEIGARTFRYKASQTAVVRGKSDLLVTLAQFQHR